MNLPHLLNEKISYFHFTFLSTAHIIIHSVLWIFYRNHWNEDKISEEC